MPRKELTNEQRQQRDPYKFQKKYYQKNKNKINSDAVKRNYTQRFHNTTKHFWSDERIKNFKKYKKFLLNIKDVDKQLLKYFRKEFKKSNE